MDRVVRVCPAMKVTFETKEPRFVLLWKEHMKQRGCPV